MDSLFGLSLAELLEVHGSLGLFERRNNDLGLDKGLGEAGLFFGLLALAEGNLGLNLAGDNIGLRALGIGILDLCFVLGDASADPLRYLTSAEDKGSLSSPRSMRASGSVILSSS